MCTWVRDETHNCDPDTLRHDAADVAQELEQAEDGVFHAICKALPPVEATDAQT